MALEYSVGSAEAGIDTFLPAEHLLGIVQRIVASRENTLLSLPGKGNVIILPERREYFSNVYNYVEFCLTPATQFELTPVAEAELPYLTGASKNISHLLWQAAFHVSRGRLAEDCSKYDVVQFRHWPNLTRLPVTPNAARICALLTRNPTTIMLVHRILGISKEEVYQIYSAANSAGIANTISHNPASENMDADVAIQPAPAQEHGLFHSLFAKISRL